MPDALLLDDGIKRERSGASRWKAQINQIAELVARESKGKAYRFVAYSALNRETSLLYRARNGLWTCPERGLESTLASQRRYQATLGGVGEKVEGSIEAGFPASVRAGNHIEPSHRYDEL